MLMSDAFRASLVGVDLIETSRKLRKAQRLKLEKHGVPLEWKDTLSWAEKGAFWLVWYPGSPNRRDE